MKIFLTLLAIHLSAILFSQQNLVPNGGFENVDETVLGRLNEYHHDPINGTGEYFPSANLSFLNISRSVFKYWYSDDHNGDGFSFGTVWGIQYAMIPGLFQTYDAPSAEDDFDPTTEDINSYGYQDLLVQTNTADEKFILSNPSANHGLKLTPNPYPQNDLLGINCSPPNSFFATNFSAYEGDNYLALIDTKYKGTNNKGYTSKNQFSAQLEQTLVKDKTYRVEITVAKMNLLDEIAQEGHFQTETPKIRIKLAKLSPSGDYEIDKQQILEETFNTESWKTYGYDFKAGDDFTHILIEFEPLNQGVVSTNKISGAFVDNVKIFEKCETALNQCDNANYRDDLMDVKLQKTNLIDPTTAPINNTYNNGYIETIRVINLENANYFQLKIFPNNISSPIRTINHYWPESTYVWDGRDDNGNVVADGKYRAELTIVRNDCYEIGPADTKIFQKKSFFSAFNISTVYNENSDGNTCIHGLSNVHNLNVKIIAMNGALVGEFNLVNPPDIIGLSNSSLNQYTTIQNLSTSYYQLVLTASNNCDSKTITLNSIYIGGLPDNSNNSTVYNWSPIPKSTTFTCPFIRVYDDNYLMPRDCCEGDLYISNVYIDNPFTTNIMHNIYIGDNVTFDVESDYNLYSGQNILFAGNAIIINPGNTSIELGGTTYLYPNQYNCIVYMPEVVQDENKMESQFFTFISQDSILETDTIALFPNPIEYNSAVTLKTNRNLYFDSTTEVTVYSSVGTIVQKEIIELDSQNMRFLFKQQLSAGLYYVYVKTSGFEKTLTLIIK